MANVTGLGLDQSQIADAINRQNVGLSQKKRNEMMRVGAQSPDSFALQNQPAIQQAQQPSEFWGAGRKLAVNQAPDLSAIYAMGGSRAKLGGDEYYYGDNDYSTAQWGTEGYQTQDAGKGLYNIIDSAGTNIGTGYKDVLGAIKDYSLESKYGPLNTIDPSILNSYKDPKFDNPIHAWDKLGMLLAQPNVPTSVGGKAVKGGADLVSGLNTLFGSTPLIYNNSVQGYKTDLSPNNTLNKNTGPISYFDKGDSWANTYSRQYLDPTTWGNSGRSVGQDSFYVSKDKAAELPGWLNNKSSQNWDNNSGLGIGSFTGGIMKWADPIGYAMHGDQWFKDVDQQGFYGAVFNKLDPVLDDIMPDHDYLQNSIKDNLGYGSQKEAFSSIAPAIVSAVVPFGGLINAADSANQGNYSGALANVVGQAINTYAPTATGTEAGGSTGVYGTGTSTGSLVADKALQGLATNTLTGTIANGGNIEEALKAAAFSSASGAAGNWLAGSLTPQYGEIAGKALGGAASDGLNSLFSGNSPVNGSLFGAMSGGLHGFLNSTAKNNDTFNQETNKKNQQTGLALSKLAQAAFKAKNNGTR